MKEIGRSVFYGCLILSEFDLPDGLTSIGAYAFFGSGLKSVEIPDSVTGLGDYAFYGCTKLKQVSIGKGVTKIASRAFRNCSALEELEIGGATEIESRAFYG